MKKYLSFFRLRFSMGLQYRVAAFAGCVCQFVWGFMQIMMYHAFYRTNATAFPMSLEEISSYIWLQQAFLALFMAWLMENEIFDSIVDGNIAYELCRPINLYNMWFSRSVANRISKAILRCVPILFAAVFLPKGYGIMLPKGAINTIMFFFTMILGLLVTVALCMVVYMLTFFTVSQQGLRIFFVSSVEFLAGEVIPIPFFPEGLQKVVELLPFASMQNVPLRVYSGNLSNHAMWKAICMQILWLIVLFVLGKLIERKALKKVTLQGG